MEKFEIPCKKCGIIIIVEPCCGANEYDVDPICEKCGGSNYYRPCGRFDRIQEDKSEAKKEKRRKLSRQNKMKENKS